jgi:hypothetical protein
VGARFKMLRENFAEKGLLGKILRADDDGVGPARTAANQLGAQKRREKNNGGE